MTIYFRYNRSALKTLSENYTEKGDLIKALSYLHRQQSYGGSASVLMDIADTYADMELYELSNEYWFRVLEKCDKEQEGICYEELAINYYFMSDYWHAGYYFQKKIQTDGSINDEGIAKEIAERLSGQVVKKPRIVYPPELADFSTELSNGKRALAMGDYKKAIEEYSKIPDGAKEYKVGASDLAVALFMDNREYEGFELNKKLIKEFSDSVSVLCNYSGMLFAKGDKAESLKYYKKAVKKKPEDVEDYYKLATCSFEQGYHKEGVSYIEEVIKDRPYELMLLQLKGIGLLNSGEYKRARGNFIEMAKIEPDNPVTKYYAKVALNLENGGEKKRTFPYTSGFPKEEINRQKAYIKRLTDGGTDRAFNILKTERAKETIDRIFYSGERELIRKCVFLLVTLQSEWSIGYILDKIKNDRVSTDVKETAVYFLILSGRKSKTYIVSDGFSFRIKPSKLKCETDREGEIFFHSYALCCSKLLIHDEADEKKLASLCDEWYEKYIEELKNFECRDISASMLYLMSKDKFNAPLEQICAIFNASKRKTSKILCLITGENGYNEIAKRRRKNDQDN